MSRQRRRGRPQLKRGPHPAAENVLLQAAAAAYGKVESGKIQPGPAWRCLMGSAEVGSMHVGTQSTASLQGIRAVG